MKQKIHPDYTSNAVVTCACGNTFSIGSTKKEIRVELCNACHPFYTGKAKFVDTAGRVDKFNKIMSKVSGASASRKGKKSKVAARKTKKANKKGK